MTQGWGGPSKMDNIIYECSNVKLVDPIFVLLAISRWKNKDILQTTFYIMPSMEMHAT